MNDKVKLFVLAGVILLVLTGFYFLLMRNAGQTDSSQIEKASVSQGAKTVKKTEVSKDADLHEIYLAGGCFWEWRNTSHACLEWQMPFLAMQTVEGNNQVRID